MEAPKFQIGQTVYLNGKEMVIKVIKKNHASGVISYRMMDETLVNQSELVLREGAPKKLKGKIEEITESVGMKIPDEFPGDIFNEPSEIHEKKLTRKK